MTAGTRSAVKGAPPVLSGWAAAWLQCSWTMRRLLRGRLLWIAAFFAMGPITFTLLVVKTGHKLPWEMLFTSLILLSGFVPPLFTATTVADEFEDRTFTYLWSRPLPRWSVLVGKLLATVPLAIAVVDAATALCFQLGQGGVSPGEPWPALAMPRALGATAVAALVLSTVAGSISTLAPRHGLAVTYAYLFVLDLSVGAMPFSIANLSIAHHILILGGLSSSEPSGSPGNSALWLLGIAVLWFALALWRLRRAEFVGGEK